MFRTVVRAYALLSLLFLLTLLVFFVARLSSLREENVTEAQRSFAEILQRAGESIGAGAEQTRNLMSPRGDEGRTGRLEAIILYTIDDGLEYLWARSPQYTDGGFTGGSGIPRIEYNELTQLKLTATVDDDSSYLLETLYTVLDRRDIYPLLRTSLIAVLAVALFATLLAIVGVQRRRTTERAQRPADERQSDAVGLSQARGEKDSSAPAHEESGDGEGEWTLDSPVSDEAPEAEARGDSMFGPSGLSRAELLLKRLSLELERAAQNEQDLTIIILEYQEQEPYDESYLRHARQLLEHFGFEDLAFEYEHRFVVIFPNTTLREGLRRVERFQKELLDSGPTSEVDHPWAGLSSRNGRLIGGNRLLQEASVALKKSYGASGRILGFEPDPEKYRAVL